MKSLINTLRFIFKHPLSGRNKKAALKRFLFYQISKLFNPYPVLYSFTSKAKLVVDRGMTGATGNVYCGLHEFEDMSFLLHFLRPDDLFVDVGANIGSYTVLASAHVGCHTIAFEPIPSSYKRLMDNIHINQIQPLVKAYNQGVGSEKRIVPFTLNLDTMNAVAIENEPGKTIEMQIDSLNHFLKDENPILIKIDVEGYETEVIKGANEILENISLKGLILELNQTSEKFGFQVSAVHEAILKYGFKPYAYEPYSRKLLALAAYGSHNTLYLRDLPSIELRLRDAPFFEIFGQCV